MPAIPFDEPTPKNTIDEIVAMIATNAAEHDDGPSHLLKILECARRHKLDVVTAENPLNERFEGRNIGTFTHFIAECYHKGLDPEGYLPRLVNDPVLDALLSRGTEDGPGAWTLGDKYMEQFPRGFWGEPVIVESRLEGILLCPSVHGTDLPAEHHATGKIDAAWEVDEAAADRIAKRFNLLDPPPPGLYAWDLKTAGKKDSILQARFTLSDQVFQYLALLALKGYEPRGFMGFKAVRYKTERQDRFQLAVVQAHEVLTEEGYRKFDYMRRLAAEKMADANGEGRAEPSMCLGYNSVCPHRMSGACYGY